jgi:hypothetical protein
MVANMSKQAKGMYNDILDSVRGEYERAAWGRKVTEDLDINEPEPPAPEGHQYGAVDTSTDPEQQQEIDDDLEI